MKNVTQTPDQICNNQEWLIKKIADTREEIYSDQKWFIEEKIQRIKDGYRLPEIEVVESTVYICFISSFPNPEVELLEFEDVIGTFSILKGDQITIDKRALCIILEEYLAHLSAKLSRIEEERILNIYREEQNDNNNDCQ